MDLLSKSSNIHSELILIHTFLHTVSTQAPSPFWDYCGCLLTLIIMSSLPVHLLYNTKTIHFCTHGTDWSWLWLKSSTASCARRDEEHLQHFLITSTWSDLSSSLPTLAVIAPLIATNCWWREVSILPFGPPICLQIFLNHQSVHKKFLLWAKPPRISRPIHFL